MKRILGTYITAILLISCTSHTPKETADFGKGATGEPLKVTELYSPLSWNNDDWSNYLQFEIEEDHIDILDQAADIKDFCPKYAALDKLQRVHVWGEFVSAMAKYESNWKTSTVYKECSKTCQYSGGCKKVGTLYCMKGGHKLDGGIVISRGLLQISLESSQGYGCGLTKPEQLHDPVLNLQCGLEIMGRQIRKKGRVTYDVGQYWAILKPSGKYSKIPEIKAMVGKLGFCK